MDKCEKCGSFEIGVGKFAGYAELRPYKVFSINGSVVLVDVCTECGHVQNMRVKSPQVFKNSLKKKG